jgi:hypothetical protein
LTCSIDSLYRTVGNMRLGDLYDMVNRLIACTVGNMRLGDLFDMLNRLTYTVQ